MLRVDVPGEGHVHRAASAAVVKEVVYETYTLQTPSGRRFTAQRDQITVPKKGMLRDLGWAQWDHRRLRGHAIYSAVVGSQAWGLAGPDSDEDVRGCYLAPFDGACGLWRVPDEIHDPGHDEAFWEVGKLVYQGLRGDANTLETLWSPLRRIVTPLGQRLLDERGMFISMNVVGSFGRYAQSQFKSIERSVARDALLTVLLDGLARGKVNDLSQAVQYVGAQTALRDAAECRSELKAVLRSLFDRGHVEQGGLPAVAEAVAEGRIEELRPAPHRPKNAYNLLRLLHSCLHWLQHGAPMIEVKADLREVLLGIKQQRTPIEQTLALAKAAASEIEAAQNQAQLPETPDYEAAHAFVLDCRRASARVSVAVDAAPAPSSGPPTDAAPKDWFAAQRLPVPLPLDVDVDTLNRFLDQHLSAGPSVVTLALSGAHAYGFESPDSDLDLKGVHVQAAQDLLGLDPKTKAFDVLQVFEGREHDYTTNDLGSAMKLLLAGNGNLIERFLGPFPLIWTPAGARLKQLAQGSLSRRCYHHYRGFAKGVLREYEAEKAKGEARAKRLLYAYRVLLTGRHLLLAGQLCTDVTQLAELYGHQAAVAELVEVKRRAEYACVPQDTAYLKDLARVQAGLDAALDTSPLPEQASNAQDVEDFMVQLRLAASSHRQGFSAP